MQWFKLYADLKDHPKRWRFEELADTEYGLHYLTAWFSYICKFAPDGNISAFTPREVARACEWKGDPTTLWDALKGAGFIDETEDGLVAHDWHEENGRFIKENSKRKEPKGYPRVDQGLPLLQDKTGQDKTGQDKTGHKTPAAGAAEGVVAPKKTKTVEHPGFDQFYAAYPRHDAKEDARKAWGQMKADLGEVLAAIKWQVKSPDHLEKTEKRFIPLPASWLRGRRWLDENPNRERPRFVIPIAPICGHTDIHTTKRFGRNDGVAYVELIDECLGCKMKFPPSQSTMADLEAMIKMSPGLQATKDLLAELQAWARKG